MLNNKILARRTQDKEREQTLAEHSANTANLCCLECSVFQIPNILYILGEIHDFGKACNAFARKLDGENISVEHSTTGAVWLLQQVPEVQNPIAKLVLQALAVAVSCHHTGLTNLADGYTSRLDEINGKLSNPVFKQNYDEMLENCNEELSNISSIIKGEKFSAECVYVWETLSSSVKSENLNARETDLMFFYLGMFTRWLYSILIDADRTDAKNFEPGNESETIDRADAFKKIVQYMDSISYPQNELNEIRGEIYNKCVEMSTKQTGLFELNVQTGGGKTLSGFRFALGNALANNLKHIIYVVPYISIIEQNAQVIRNILKKVDCENILVESHSNVVRFSENEIDSKFDKFFTNWDEPIIFTTMVGFLESVYCGKTQNNRRFHNLANSVIIFDEVQALPKRCVGLFNLLVKFLQNMLHCTILLCSATQPTLSQLGMYSVNKNEVKMLCLNNTTKIIEKEYPTLKRTEIIFDDDKVLDKESAVNYILDKFENSKNLLVIVNTKRAAKELFLELKKNAKCYHLSTNMCAQHRLDTIKTVSQALKNNERFILISTQLIEAGVDLDFECVIRSQCGVDSIIQSAGRCNREGKLIDDMGNKRLGKVFIIKLDSNLENLNRLEDIAEGQGFLINCKMRNNDITSKASIDDYFHQMYSNVAKLKYSHDNTNLVDELIGKTSPLKNSNQFNFLKMNFKTVADSFNVIPERNTVSVLVPYGRGDELIKNISKLDKKDAKNCQRYTVEIGANKINNFSKFDGKTGIWYCVGCYDPELGLLDEAPNIEFEGGLFI